MIRILVLLVTISSIQCLDRSQDGYLKFLASQHADRFEESFREAYEELGAHGIRVYFTDDFVAIQNKRYAYRKEQYVKHLSENPDALKFFFPSQRTAFFDLAEGLLIVRFYYQHILHSFQLVPDSTLYGGYQIQKLSIEEENDL